MAKNGIKVVRLLPVCYLMNTPLEVNIVKCRFRQLMLPLVWRDIRRTLYFGVTLGAFGKALNFLIGLALYNIDGIILKWARNGPSTKLLLAQVMD